MSLRWHLFSHFPFAQSSYSVHIQDQTIEIAENINTFQWSQMPQSSQIRSWLLWLDSVL